VGLFSGLEGSLEKYIEGFFRDKFKGRVQPVDIAKRLAREMRDKKRVSVNLVYAPNEYTVYLSREDWQAVGSIAGALASELQEYLSQKAVEKDFTLVARPLVIIQGDENLKPGQLRVESVFSASPQLAGEVPGDGRVEEFEDTLCYRSLRDTSPVPVVKQDTHYLLVVQEGPQKGRIYELEGFPLVVGRREGSDVLLSDNSISRRHARLEFSGGAWAVTDLGSTNGTFVNGLRVNNKELAPGDVVKFGSTLCMLKVE
jgi:hypothetical protein